MNFSANDRIKQRRKELDLDADFVAKELGISRATYYRYENKDIEKVPISALAPLAKILHTTPEYLMGWEDDTQKHQEYYLNPETAKLAQEIHDDPELRILMDASRDLEPEDIKFVVDLVKKLKLKERGDHAD